MKLTITDQPSPSEENYIIDNLWAHNSTIDDVYLHPLLVTVKNDQDEIIGGLVCRTWWGVLDIMYLWVHKEHRKTGIGFQLMEAAENEAVKRGCHKAIVDTFDFQAVGFYEKRGYRKYGKSSGYAQKHIRYYLEKDFV